MTKSELTTRLDAWQTLKQQRDKIDRDADGQLKDLIVTFEKKAEPINLDREQKLAPVIEKMEALESEIHGEMLRLIKPDGTIGIPQIETAHALAQVHASSKREIDPAAFIRATPPGRRNEAAFFGCLTVQIGKAEKFLDQRTMNKLARPKITHSVAVTLKSE